MSFDNGHQQPPVYSRQPSYQPQTPLPHPQPYDYPQQYSSHGDLPYPIQVAASASGKRKAQRASQVCGALLSKALDQRGTLGPLLTGRDIYLGL
jgi:hypothetical protein